MMLHSSAHSDAWPALAQGLDHSVLVELQPIIEAIVASRHGGPPQRHDVAVTLPATKGRILVVSVRTAQTRAKRRADTTILGLDAAQLRCVIATIEAKMAEPISVSVLSSVVGLSRSHFSHAFRLAVGETPHRHVVRLRIERAMKLMVETGASLSDIALATGFSDQAHLCHAFRRASGTKPARWRKARQAPCAVASPTRAGSMACGRAAIYQ